VFNTLAQEQNYLSSVIWMIKADVARTQATRKVENIAFIGTMHIFPGTDHSRKNFPLIGKIDPAVSTYTYPFFLMSRSTGLKIIRTDTAIFRYRPVNYVSRSCDYTMYMFSSTAVVNFKTHCQRDFSGGGGH
jgi:hypothetical protein